MAREMFFVAGHFFVANNSLYIYSLIMNQSKPVRNRFVARREAVLRQIATIGPFIEGTLVKRPHKQCRHVAHRLTFKAEGKTQSVYVPLDRVEDVEAWIRQYKRLKALIKAATKASVGELKNHVRSRKARKAAPKSAARPRRT